MGDIQPVRLGDKYILLDLIGSGGMAEVFRSKLTGEKGFEKLIVIKRLLDQVAKEPEMIEHFTAEARLAALLQHENIATIYDFGEIDQSYFIAMEYLFGKNLHSVIQAAKKSGFGLRPEYGLMIASKICEAMGYAHRLTDFEDRPLHIIHRDLTPHNIFITYDGKVKILDFGIAKTEMHDNRTRVGVVKGKITYMSPEQLAGDPLDSRSDIFSIGILLYEMLSGRRMYSGDTAALIRKAITADYTRLEEIHPHFDSGVYTVLNNTLKIDPGERYQTCEEMKTAVDRSLGNMSLQYDPLLLQAFMRKLFSQEYEEEKKQAISALQAASRFDSGNPRVDEDKTMILEPDNLSGVPESGRKHRHPDVRATSGRPLHRDELRINGFPVNRKVMLSGILIFGMACLVIFLLLRHKSPSGAGTASELQNSGEAAVESVVATTFREAAVVTGQGEFEKEQKKAVDELARQAENALAIGNLTLPEGGSALYYFKKIEQLVPGDHRAAEGYRRIAERYAELAEREINNREFLEASGLVEKGLAVFPDSGRLQGLHTRLERERTQITAELANRAEVCLAENRLTTPYNNSALKYYREIEKIDAGSTLALDGYRKIGVAYARLADRAFRELDLDGSRHYVSEGLEVDPDNWELRQLERELLKSKPEIFFKSIEKNLKKLF